MQFEGVLPEAGPCVAYASIDLDGQVGTVSDVPPEVYRLVHLAVHLARCLYADCGGELYIILGCCPMDRALSLREGWLLGPAL